MTDKIIRVKIEAGDSAQQIKQLDGSMVALGSNTDATTSQLDGLNTKLTQTAEGVKNATSKVGQFAQQAGFQIQDFTNQVAGGQSALLAFGQQAPQLLGTFGVGGAVWGAVIAISAAIGGTLVNAIKDAKKEAGELPPEIKKFAEDIGKKFAEVDFSNRADLARVEVGKLNTEYDKTLERVTALRAEVKDIELFGPSSRFVKDGEQYTKAWRDARFELEASENKLDLVRQKLEQIDNISKQGLGTDSLDNLADSAGKVADKSETLQRGLLVQNTLLKQGELAARLQAAAFGEGVDSADKLSVETKKLVTENYNLEQSQKAQKAASEELQKQIENELRLEAERFKADQEKERRAERERQRINERIANMQLEAQTYSAQSELMRAVEEGRFSQEEAALAARTASKILAANNEFNLLMENKSITDEQKEAAEAAHLERLAEIRRQYVDGQTQIDQQYMDAQSQYAQQLQSIQLNTAANALSAMSSFAKQGSGVQKALFLALKGVQAAQAYTSGLTAAMLARATIPYPASEPIALAQIAAGKVSAAAIMATGLAGAFGGGGGVSVGGGSMPAAASTATLPTTPQSAPMVGSIEFIGLSDLKDELRNNDGMVSTRFVASILDKIEDANRLRGTA